MHEEETHKHLKQEYFNLKKFKSPQSLNLYCVFPDGSYSVGRLEEWKSFSEFLWMIKCRINLNISRQFARQGVMNYLLVDISTSKQNETTSDDYSQHVLGNIIVTVSTKKSLFFLKLLTFVQANDRPNPRQPIKLMLCSSPLAEKKVFVLMKIYLNKDIYPI